ncbi:hypothetical protein [Fodinicurvata fenggangensis]|uniref:hypothetical protein n=1 Tax=Fodinicurvata fenggangensis TaxID=1121830 RepID=UPI00047B856B|nr:hypothetical protein [Fodinicurvata fenggangensis]
MTERDYLSEVPDLQDVSEEVVKEALREGELHLQAQLQTALAADQRALVIFSVYTTAAMILFGTTAGLFQAGGLPLGVGIFLVGAGVALGLAAVYAWRAFRPGHFTLPGNAPEQWYQDFRDAVTLVEARADQLAWLQRAMDRNETDMSRRAESVKASASLAFRASFLAFAAAVWAALDAAAAVEALVSRLFG